MNLNSLYDPNLLIQEGRILLRPIADADMDRMLEMYGDESIYRYRPGLPRKTELLITKLLKRQRKEMEEKTAVYLAVCDADAPRMLIGVVEVYNGDPRIEKAEIGYTIAPSMQHKGYGRAAVGAITDYLFNACEANRVTAIVHVENIASQQVLLQNGFTKEGIEREGAFWQGIGYVDICCFAKLKKDNKYEEIGYETDC